MSGFWNRLNLRPNERRLIVGVAVVLFIVLNAFLVWPHFKDWSQMQERLFGAQSKLGRYQTEVNQMPEYKRRLQTLEGDGGAAFSQDQDIQLLRTIQTHAAETGVNITQTPKAITQTNEFFLEQVQNLSLQGREEQLVNFLYNLGSGNSMVRVRDLSLRPELPARQQLSVNVRLVASFPRKPAAKPAPSTPQTAAANSPTQNR